MDAEASNRIDSAFLEREDFVPSTHISVGKHNSCGIGVAAHYDCAGNPVGEDVQLKQLKQAVDFISKKYAGLIVVGLWVDQQWSVREV